MMQEQIIVESIFDSTNVQEDEIDRINILVEAIAENEQLKERLEKLQKEVNKYPVLRTIPLKDVAMPGMHVSYDAGTWDRTIDVPNPRHILPWKRHGFSMFTKGKSKNDSVMDYHGNLSPSGWKVLGVICGNVHLIHAGIACVYSPHDKYDVASEVKAMVSFCLQEFANSPYAKEAICVNKSLFTHVKSVCGDIPKDLFDVGAPYWFATVERQMCLAYYDRYEGGIVRQSNDDINPIYGIRPVVILKKDVKVLSGDGTKDNPIKLTL